MSFTRRWIERCWRLTAGTTSPQTARCEFLLDYEEEDDDETRAAARSPKRKSPGVSAGPTTSATKSSPASSNSTNNATKKNCWPAKPADNRSKNKGRLMQRRQAQGRTNRDVSRPALPCDNRIQFSVESFARLEVQLSQSSRHHTKHINLGFDRSWLTKSEADQ